MKKIIGLTLLILTFDVSAEIVTTSTDNILEFTTWAETNAGVDGDTVIKMNTGRTECPDGVYIKASEHSKNLLSTTLAAYMSNKKVNFQVWTDSNKFWAGSSNNPYCKVRAVRLKQ